MLPQCCYPSQARTFDNMERQEVSEHRIARKDSRALWRVAIGSAVSGALVAVSAIGVAWYASGASAGNNLADITDVAPWTSRRSVPGGLSFEETKAEKVLGELSAAEVRSVAAWVIKEKGANPVRRRDANSTWIAGPSGIELLIPSKREVLAFLDGQLTPPKRFARVTLVGPEGVVEYSVGPLENGAVTEDASMKVLRPAKDTPYSKRPTEGGADTVLCESLLNRTYRDLAPIIVPAWGNIFPAIAGFTGAEGEVMELQRPESLAPAGLRFDLYKLLWAPPPPQTLDAFWLHPIPLDIRINTTQHDPSKWIISDIYFCNARYESTAEILQAHKHGALTVCPFKRETGTWDWPQHETPPDPAGRKPLEDHGGVKWGPWSFTVTTRPSTGPALLDIKFNDERVLYELSMQDAAADYSGTEHTQFFYSDASWSLAMFGTSLEPGVDCPHGAHYLKATSWYHMLKGGGAHADPTKAFDLVPICIFEWQEDHTVWRHMVQSDPPSVHGLVRGTVVVRSITTVGNYDYITDLKFREDGEIEVSTKFAGYLETRYFNTQANPWERNFSAIMRGNLAGPVHSHLVCFKADIDVAGVLTNALRVTKVKSMVIPKALSQSRLDRPIVSKYLEQTDVVDEGVGKSTFVANPQHPANWAIVDRASDKKTGNPRGYAIVLNSFATTQVLPDDHPFVTAMPFTKYHLAVTRHHDDEYRATSPYIQYDGYQSEVSGQNLDRFLADGEDLLDKDLVAWVGVGREHITRQEDLPLVSNFGSGFSLQPWNFFEHNVGASPLHRD